MSTTINESIRRSRQLAMEMRSVNTIMGILNPFIPDICRREAADALIGAFRDSGFELTATSEREQYEAWKATILTQLDSEPLAIPEKPVADMSNAELAAALRGKATPSPFLRNGPMAQMLEAAKRLEKMP